MALTATTPTSAEDKGWMDFFSSIIPSVASTVASTVGIDPRVAGQTVSQVMSIFGIGKAFTTQVAKDQAVAQLKEIVTPHLDDPAFTKALGMWLQAAIQPIQAHKEGKEYSPDLSKSWLSDAWDTVTDTVADVDWGQVAQIGMRTLPLVLAVL
ncbi:hypothetical protein [Tessaracoccus antarcticus]|uniref:Uncharacterized protein n=1 Tax=Tessaracoccus antarcticus TaxID=2479848 RepID=A0A3M0G5S0_9ACTN|nr:hypothetical protein [Tessaracoccus antarcticus]RMB60235.1 hypothetical protein EAX62_11185 [Tessaracoccus antarcticus]